MLAHMAPVLEVSRDDLRIDSVLDAEPSTLEDGQARLRVVVSG